MSSPGAQEGTAKLYYESHVTIEPVFDEALDIVREIVGEYRFRVADLLVQKRNQDTPQRSSKDTFCTAHSTDLKDIEERTHATVKALRAAGYVVWRYKIEDTLLDSRHDDCWGIL